MGTSCSYGFKKNGEYKTTYRHYDGYYSEGGQVIVEFIEELEDLNQLDEIFNRLKMVPEDRKITEKRAESFNQMLDKAKMTVWVSKQNWKGDFEMVWVRNQRIKPNSMYFEVFREFQGDLSLYTKTKIDVMSDFPHDEGNYRYVINLDDQVLEVSHYDDEIRNIPLEAIRKNKGLDLEFYMENDYTIEVSIKINKMKKMFKA